MTLPEIPEVTKREALQVWLRVALLSFGGPAGQIGVIHRIIVDEKRWLSEARFLHALSYCMLLPGPEAQQLTTYVGWLLHGVRGGLVAGLIFIAPGFIAILLLSFAYVGYHDTAIVAGIFYGLKPAVIAVVFEAVLRLRRRTLRDGWHIAVAVAAFVGIFFFHIPFPATIALAAAIGLGVRSRDLTTESHDLTTGSHPSLSATLRTVIIGLCLWSVPVIVIAMTLGRASVFTDLGMFFSKTAVVTFGGAYAVLSYVAQQAVDTYQWLAPGEMLDGLGMAETTPGPLIQVVQFVGFLAAFRNSGGLDPFTAGLLGAVITTWVTFVPCFLFIFAGAPYVEYLRGNQSVQRALRGISAAVVGAVLNLAVWFSMHTIFRELEDVRHGPLHFLIPNAGSLDLVALLIATGSLIAMLRLKTGMLMTLGLAGLAGITVTLLRG